jgi:peptidoglycan/xylan/chitin deacetylase (PgdA/CDA1 family)
MKKVLLVFLFSLLFESFLFAKSQESESAVIFMYHRFGETKYPSTNIRLEQFEKHLEYLSQNGYQVWPLSKIVRHLLEQKAIPKKTVALTIDDAYKSIYTEAFPRLKKFNFPFTVFVNTMPIDNGSKSYMSWEQMREMSEYGAEFANHSISHDYLIPRDGEDKEAWHSRIGREIEIAQKRLQDELGAKTNQNPKLFSYPFGEYTKETAEFIQSLGYVGVTQTSGAIDGNSDTKMLPRFAMSESFADMDGFLLKLNTLPLPIESLSTLEPIVGDENPPKLTIKLKKEIKNIGCYLSNGDAIPVNWISDMEFSVKADRRLKSPRERYTCTAKANDEKWYWYSNLWIIK